MLCVTIKGPSYADAAKQIEQAIALADLVELRLDLFSKVDIAALKKLRAQFSEPMIFTLRSQRQGGNFVQSEAERMGQIRLLAELKPEYLDLEFDMPLDFIQEIAHDYPEVKQIISYHNFEETPHDLDRLFQEISMAPAAFYKMAVQARSTLDALRLMVWAKNQKMPIIAIAMGSYGQISRILAPVIGSLMTFASDDEEFAASLGQLSAKVLCERYHYKQLCADSKVYGVIGDPVSKSIGDQTHNHIFATFDMPAVYVKMQLQADELHEFLQLAKALPMHGLSVTMPLKESVMPHLDQIDDKAAKIGAVNTLVLNDSKWIGFNTDGVGALNAIEETTPVKDKRVIVIGAGGAAKAIVHEACCRQGNVTVINRDFTKAQNLAAECGCKAARLDEMTNCAKEGYDILINSTPLEMPISESSILPHTVVMDIKTRPKITELIANALSKDCQVICGYQMYVEQALGQYKLWFGENMQHAKVRKALMQIVKTIVIY